MSVPKIPLAASQRRRLFLERILPGITFLLGVVGATLLWQQAERATFASGWIEPIAAEIRANTAGRITQLHVNPWQQVEEGALVATIAPLTPEERESQVAVLRAELRWIEVSQEPLLVADRVRGDAVRTYLDLLRARVDCAETRGRVEDAAEEVRRCEPLHKAGILSEDTWSEAQRKLTTLREVLSAQESFFRTVPSPDFSSDVERVASLEAALALQLARVRALEESLAPRQVLAPCSGQVVALLRRGGEYVLAGECLVQLQVGESASATAYLRPSALSQRPAIGDRWTVRLRDARRGPGQLATVTAVGHGFSALPAVLRTPALPATTPELGLPVALQLDNPGAYPPGAVIEVDLP